jgi:carbamoyl-phosphate synthase large subunit
LPTSGAALITVNDFDKAAALKLGRDLHRLGFKLYATSGTAAFLQRANLPVTVAAKVSEGGNHTVELVTTGKVQLIINTPLGQRAHDDSRAMRAAAIRHNVPLLTTLSAAQAAVNGIRALREKELKVRSLQVHYRKLSTNFAD